MASFYLLTDCSAVKKDVALVVGHELAHQWFGNLVSSLSLFEPLFVHRVRR